MQIKIWISLYIKTVIKRAIISILVLIYQKTSLVLVTLILITKMSEKTNYKITSSFEVLAPTINNFVLPLKWVPYIYYLIYFKKDKVKF